MRTPLLPETPHKAAVEILLIEDNEADAELTLRALKKHRFTNNLTIISDGAEAVDYIFRRGDVAHRPPGREIDLILLDLNLPQVSGIEILRLLHDDAETRHIPVIILASTPHDREVIEKYQLAVTAYIVKPLTFQSFVEAVHQLGFHWTLAGAPAK